MFNNYMVVKTKDGQYSVITDRTNLKWFGENVHSVIQLGIGFAEAHALKNKLTKGEQNNDK